MMKKSWIQLSVCLSLLLVGFGRTAKVQGVETDTPRSSEVIVEQQEEPEINKEEEISANDMVKSTTEAEENQGETLRETEEEKEENNHEELPPSESTPTTSNPEPEKPTIYQDLTGYYGVQVKKQDALTETHFLEELQKLTSSQSLGFDKIEQMKLLQPVSTKVPGNFVATLTFKDGDQLYEVKMRYHVINTEATLPLELIQIDKKAYKIVAKSVPYATFALRFHPFPQPSMYRSGETGIITLDYSPDTFPEHTDFSVLKADLKVSDDNGNFSSVLFLSHEQLFASEMLTKPLPVVQPKENPTSVNSPTITRQKTPSKLPQTGEKNQGVWTVTGLVLLGIVSFSLSLKKIRNN